jgi:hypothetical protein
MGRHPLTAAGFGFRLRLSVGMVIGPGARMEPSGERIDLFFDQHILNKRFLFASNVILVERKISLFV